MEASGLLIVHCRQQVLCLDEQPLLPASLLAELPGVLAVQSLPALNGQPLQVCELQQACELQDSNLDWLNLRHFLRHPDAALFALLRQASQLATWRRDHRFCGACGTSLQLVENDSALACPACQLHVWPRLSPSIIVLISRGEQILLARSPRFRSGFFSVLAGFVEVGESLEECVHREVMEEVGLQIDNLQYITSQSWPFPHSLMIGFHAEYVAGEIVPQPGEIEEADWFHIDQLPDLPVAGTISRYLIDLHLQQRRPVSAILPR